MASGVIKGVFVDNDNNLRPEIHWSYSQNVTKNQTTITCTLKIYKKTSYGSTYKSNTACKMTMNGETLYSATKSLNCSNVSTGSYLTVGSFTKTITHNSSGQFVYSGTTGKMSLYGSIDFSGNNPGWGYVPSKGNTTSITIPSIPISSNIDSVTNNVAMNGSNKITTNLTLGLSSYSCKVTYSIGDYSYTITDSSSSSKSRTVSYAPPKSWCNAIPNATSSKLTVTCKTYSGSTLIDTTSKTVTVTVPTDIVPTISSWSISAGNSYSTINNIKYWLKDLSTAKVTATGAGSYSSKISKIDITFPSGTYPISNGGSVTKLLTKSGTVTITAKVYDTRGRSKTYSKSITVRDYKYPYIDNFKITKVSKDNEGVYYEDDTSKTLKISFKVGAHKITKDTVPCVVTYTNGTASGTAINSTGYTIYSTVTEYVTISSLDSASNYTFSCKVTDEVGKTSTSTFILKPEALIFDFNKSGQSLGIGIKSTLGSVSGLETYDVVHVGGKEQNDNEKSIRYSNTSTATNKHSGKLYGGDGSNTIAFGFRDLLNSRNVFSYYDASNTMTFTPELKCNAVATTMFSTSGNISLETNSASLRSVDTNGRSINMAYVSSGNSTVFGGGSYNGNQGGSNSQLAYDNGSIYLGGAYAMLKSREAVYLCCNSGNTDSSNGSTLKFYKNSDGNCVFIPTAPNTNYCGTLTYHWKHMFASNFNNTSDRTLKENVKYLSNYNGEKSTILTLDECYDFVKKDLSLATYNYIGDTGVKVGFIAQDVVYNIDESDNKVGQIIVDLPPYSEENKDDKLTYDVNNVLGVTLAALQKAMEKIEQCEDKIAQFEKLLKENNISMTN